VQKTRQGELGSSRAAANLGVRFEDERLHAGLLQNDGRGQAVRSGADDDGVTHVFDRGTRRARTHALYLAPVARQNHPMPQSIVELPGAAGVCKTQLFTPEGAGPWPAVILAFDAGGQRASMSAIAERIAKWGYLVAIPDLYYRVGSIYDLVPADAPHTFQSVIALIRDPERRGKWQSTYAAAATSYDNLKTDIGALLDLLSARPDVHPGVGVTGYCMGGNISLRIAALFGGRIAAAASFHGGGLVTPAPDSVHLRAAQIKASVYVAGASEDAGFTDEIKATLTAALSAAGVTNTVETYAGKHGFAVVDNPVFDPPSAERHYAALKKFFAETLR
jgi:carboxymethylenebutenolidase